MRAAVVGVVVGVMGARAGVAWGDDDGEEAPLLVQTLVEATEVAADLRVRQLPVRMRIRPAAVVAAAATTAAATTAAASAAQAGATEAPATSATSAPGGGSWRERVSFQIRAGVELDTAGDSGEPMRGGARLPEDFAASRPWILGDAIVGARNVVLPSLGAYLLSSFQLDASDSLASRAASIAPSDADELPVVIKAGYAEYGRDDLHQGKRLWLRGGRQVRLDGGAMFAYFDGATVGYRMRAWDVSAFAGRRVALYVDTEHGLTYGATAAYDLAPGREVPLKLAADVLGLALDDETRLLGVLRATYEPAKRARIDVRARFVDPGAGALGLGRAGARVRLSAKSLIVVADVEHRRGGDLAYDLASPAAVDVVQIAQRLGVGLAAPIDATTVGARVDWRNRKSSAEVLAFARAEVPHGTVTAVDQRGWIEAGAAVAGTPLGSRGRGVWATAQYKLREYPAGGDGGDGMGSAFGDTSTSGLARLHEVAADATLASSGGGGRGRRWRASAGGFYRVYDFGSPYAEVTNEGRGGGRADLQIWLSRALRAEVAAELAQPSAALARELGVMSSVRGAVEARW